MLSGLLRLELRFPTAVPCSNGESNHREFLRQLVTIDAEAAALMHGKNESTLRPFTISSLRGPHKRSSHVWLLSAGTFNVRLTALTSTAEVLVRSVFQYSREWQILGAQFAVTGFCDTPTESDWALTLTHDEFVSAAVFAATLRRDRILLRFHSPTAFARSLSPAGPTTIHFPEVLAIFGALRRKFVEFSEFTETPPSVEELTSYISLGRYDVHTRRLSFGAHNTGRTGFLEDVELLVDRRASSELVDWIHILCRYGFFCGMGVSTSWGMGQVRVEPHEDLVSGVLSKYKANSAVAG